MIYFIFLASLASVTCFLCCHWRNRKELRLRNWSFLFASSALWVKEFTVYANIRYMSFQIMVRTVSIGWWFARRWIWRHLMKHLPCVMKLIMEWLKHWKNGIKYVDRLLNFYYTCVKTQWIWRTTSKGVWEKTVFQGVGKFSKIMLPHACSASNVSWKRLISKFSPTYHFCLPSLVRTSIAPCHHHGQSCTVDAPDQARIPAIAFPPCEIDCTYRYKFPQGSLPPPSGI